MTTRTLSKSFQSLHTRPSLAAYPNLFFWLCFLSLNALLFLPSYILNRESSTFLPLSPGLEQDPAVLTRQLLVWRNNLDLFRLNAEFTLLIAIWIFLPLSRTRRVRRFFLALLTFSYILTFTYALYESLTIYFYQVDAVFYAHIQLLIDGLNFLVEHLQLSPLLLVAGGLAFLAWSASLILFIRVFVERSSEDNLSIWSRVLLGMFLLLILSAVLQNRSMLASPKSVISSLVVKLQKNVSDSFALSKQVRSLDDLEFHQVYDYGEHRLLSGPNIYLVFVESYGSILYKREAFREKYLDIIGEKQVELQNDGWLATSALSESPTWGGGSWLAYTSVLFGLRVDNHPQYLSLLDRFQDQDYPDLGFTLQSLGYNYIRATSLAVELDDQEWQKYVNFFGVDDWIRYRDFDYQGVHYGWGPSPPDQYVLNAAREMITDQWDQPFLLFLITQNSHYPWRKVPKVVDDWRTLNDGNAVVATFEEDAVPLHVRQEDYINAISYELDFLTDFILKEAGDEDIFILIGDHQPGYVTRRIDGFDTPVHIVSKDPDFIEAFSEYGFKPGLEVEEITSAIRHEGLYSLFMRIFLQQYGQGIKTIPPYLPDGIELKTN